jgi:hypothetical protein
MTGDEIKEKLSGEVDANYIITLEDGTSYQGLIEGPYSGSFNSRIEQRRYDYLYLWALSAGLSKPTLLSCPLITAIEPDDVYFKKIRIQNEPNAKVGNPQLNAIFIEGKIEDVPNGTPGETIRSYTWTCDPTCANFFQINGQDLYLNEVDYMFFDIHWATQPNVPYFNDCNPQSGNPTPDTFEFQGAPPYSILWQIGDYLNIPPQYTKFGIAKGNGRVRLVVNDQYYPDNQGYIKVAIQASNPPIPLPKHEFNL